MADILNAQHLDQIKAGIAAANEGLRQVQKAKMAGLDMGAQEAQLQKNLDTLLQLKQVYFPGQ
ncbi:MAG TPA: hypothetical protein VJR90_00030 [Gammaproteobacteria bacterium]|jgi:hypothetical protein|nr:hypothetical protein [Gammaproteobacteria bacterium]